MLSTTVKVQPVLRKPRACVARASSGIKRSVPARTASILASADVMGSFSFSHIMLTILDSHELLSEGSKSALSAAAQLAVRDQSKVTVLVIEEPGTAAKDPAKQIESLNWHLKSKGCVDFAVLQRSTTQPASVMVGDVADEVAADMVVVSSEAVHAKYVDANQLAEFVSCPLLVLP